MKRVKRVIILILVLIFAFMVYVGIGIPVSRGLDADKIKLIVREPGRDIKIAQISDLHYPYTDISTDEILDALAAFLPDFIFLTGDIIDSSTASDDILALGEFFKKLRVYQNVYACPGNHEAINDNLKQYKETLAENGIIYLAGEAVQAEAKGVAVVVAGLKDRSEYGYDTVAGLADMPANSPVLLLAHRADKWRDYRDAADAPVPAVTFAGHNHGGQIRLFGKGFLSPGRGFRLPLYTSGLYQSIKHEPALVVSRGLGNSDFPLRVYNKFHLPLVTVKI